MGPSSVCDDVGAVIVAAGSARRMDGIDKIFSPLAGKPVLCWSVEALQQSQRVRDIVVVVRADQTRMASALLATATFTKVRSVVTGGSRRQDSVAAGVRALADSAWIAIHDGARPLATPNLLDRLTAAAARCGAAIPALAVSDTIKRVRDGHVVETIDRGDLWAVQTPQLFRRDILERCLAALADGEIMVTDESSAAERLGVAVAVVEGEHWNRKITTREDLFIVEAHLSRRARHTYA